MLLALSAIECRSAAVIFEIGNANERAGLATLWGLTLPKLLYSLTGVNLDKNKTAEGNEFRR